MYYIKKILVVSVSLLLLSGCGEITYSDNNITQKDTGTKNSNNEDSNNEETQGTVIEIETSQYSGTTGKTIYGRCAACHGSNGEKVALGKSGIIGGDSESALIYQLQEYQAGRLNQYGMGELMKGQLGELSEIELKLVANYVSRLSGI